MYIHIIYVYVNIYIYTYYVHVHKYTYTYYVYVYIHKLHKHNLPYIVKFFVNLQVFQPAPEPGLVGTDLAELRMIQAQSGSPRCQMSLLKR